MKKFLSVLFVIIFVIGCCSCREACIADYNLSKEADYFNCERRITVYNARTDKLIFTLEGYFSLKNNDTNELVITCKVGENEYKNNYVYLTENTLYVMEDITGTHTDPYHYQLIWHTEVPISFETKE